MVKGFPLLLRFETDCVRCDGREAERSKALLGLVARVISILGSARSGAGAIMN
jgi:hypothetical protein